MTPRRGGSCDDALVAGPLTTLGFWQFGIAIEGKRRRDRSRKRRRTKHDEMMRSESGGIEGRKRSEMTQMRTKMAEMRTRMAKIRSRKARMMTSRTRLGTRAMV